MHFSRAIVRTPCDNFADGLTTVDFGVPALDQVLAQHAAYCQALEGLGLSLTWLPADPAFPDSTFVEDAAVLTPHAAMLTRPGAASRLGEVSAIAPTVRSFYPDAAQITAPGTLDGGDICEAGTHFFLGVSLRTNPEGANQLAHHLAAQGYTSSVIDIRHMTSILHLKSGIAFIGDNTLVVMEEMAADPQFASQFAGYRIIVVPQAISYAANCVRVNDRVLVAQGYPTFERQLTDAGFHPLALDMSEFRKMDGGLSCLSLRF